MKLLIKLSTVIILLLTVNSAFADAWEQRSSFGGVGRHRGTAFSIQDKGYMGLGHINSVVNTVYEDIWEYDPGSDTWTQKANFAGGPRYHAVSFSIGNKAYCGTGRSASALNFSDMYEYDPVTNVWTQMSDIAGVGRTGGTAFTINGKGYVGCGSVASAGANDFYEYDATTDSWSMIAQFPGPGRNTGVSFSIGNKGYYGTAFGDYGAGNDFWEYKPSTDQWLQLADVGPTARAGASGFAIQGKGYILTGTNWGTGENFKDVWEFNPLTNSWRQLQDFPGSTRRFLECFSIGNIGYCGIGTNGINFRDFWSFDASTVGFDEVEEVVVSVYPNPTSNEIRFNYNQTMSEASVRLYNLNGKKVKDVQIDQSNTISCADLSNGTYVYQFYNDSKFVSQGKIVVTK
jgi:N-acetylneuraminic acid mutarotase